MKLLPITLALGGAALLAACGEKTKTDVNMNATASAVTDNRSANMDNMAMPSEAAKVAKATGMVKAIDKAAGTITLEHGPIAEANWPAMTMAFKAPPALLDGVAVGDKVAFDLKLDGNSGEVTAINKQ